MTSLPARACFAIVLLSIVMAALLFVPAGTVRYWQAWVYLIVFNTTSILITLYLVKEDPALLERRMKGGPTAEKRPAQQLIMVGTSTAFIGLLVVPALDHRFGWSRVPVSVVITGNLLVILGFFLIFLVYRENTYSSATIELAPDQKVVSTGPYAVVRHPMYASALLYLFGTPLALGSYWGLAALAFMLPFLVWRLFD